jgi:phytol kinase
MSGSEIAMVVLIFLGVFTVLIGSACLPAIYKISDESRRKMLHIAAGILAMGLPAVFTRPAPVIVLCVAVLVALIAMRFSKRRIYDADRISYGELCIPIAAAFLFVASRGDSLNYNVPLAILTFADSTAAIVGQRCPAGRIRILGRKTLAGSVAFFAIAFLVTLGGVAFFAGVSPGTAFAMALIVAFDLTVVELVCRYGLDNLLVPLAGFFLLNTLRHADAVEIAGHLALAAMAAALLAVHMSVRIAVGHVQKRRTQ